jgi:hypothetical protein
MTRGMAGQVTTCGVAGRISWSQPGHRYALLVAEPVSDRTTQSPSDASSTGSACRGGGPVRRAGGRRRATQRVA